MVRELLLKMIKKHLAGKTIILGGQGAWSTDILNRKEGFGFRMKKAKLCDPSYLLHPSSPRILQVDITASVASRGRGVKFNPGVTKVLLVQYRMRITPSTFDEIPYDF